MADFFFFFWNTCDKATTGSVSPLLLCKTRNWNRCFNGNLKNIENWPWIYSGRHFIISIETLYFFFRTLPPHISKRKTCEVFLSKFVINLCQLKALFTNKQLYAIKEEYFWSMVVFYLKLRSWVGGGGHMSICLPLNTTILKY